MATIQDVAKKAQVSPATVSRVYNKPELVQRATRERILLVAEELGYSPNQIARGLKSGVTNVVALIVPDVTNPMFGIFARGCGDKLSEVGLTLALYNSDEDITKEQEIMEVIKQRQTDGVIMTSRTAEPGHSESAGYQLEMPCVYIERVPRRKGVDTIHMNNSMAAALAAGYLMERGHERIGIVTGLMHTYTGRILLESFQETMLAGGLALLPENVFQGNLKLDCGPSVARQILSAKNPPSAIYFSNDLMAFSAMMTLLEEDVKIPEELAIIGNGDLPMASMLSPKLTTIHYPIYQHGYQAAEILLERIKEPEQPERHLLLEPSLIIRESA